MRSENHDRRAQIRRRGRKLERQDWDENAIRDFHPDVSGHTRNAAQGIQRAHLATLLRFTYGRQIEAAGPRGACDEDPVETMVDAYLTARRMRPERDTA